MAIEQKLAESHGLHWGDMSEYDKEAYRVAAREYRFCDVCGRLTDDWSKLIAFGIETTACERCRS